MKGDQAEARREQTFYHQWGLNPLWSHLSYVLTTFCFLGFTTETPAATQRPDQELKIGIVQRFGDEPTDKLNLEATPGDRLTLKFKSNERQQTLQASSAKLEIVMQPLPTPVVEERVVLSTHRSFETAEDSFRDLT